MINSLSFVDSGFIVEEMRDFERVVLQFGVNRVFKSEKFVAIGRVYGVTDTDAEMMIVPDVPGLKSTTWIIDKIRKNRNVEVGSHIT